MVEAIPTAATGSILREEAEEDGVRVRQVWKPPSPSEKLAPAHLTEEEGCHCVTPPVKAGRDVRGQSFAKLLAAASRDRCQA